MPCSCWLWVVCGAPPHPDLSTYTIGHLGEITPCHRDALLHRGLQRAQLWRLIHHVALTTVLLHKWHAIPILLLAGSYTPRRTTPLDVSVARPLSSSWYHVANWEFSQETPRWPLWDVLIGLWISDDLNIVLPYTNLIASIRRPRSPQEHILYVYTQGSRTSPVVLETVKVAHPEVIILDSATPTDLSTSFPDLCCLWVVHYGRYERHFLAGL